MKYLVYFILDMFDKKTLEEKVLHYTYRMKASELLVISQERDLRVIVDSSRNVGHIGCFGKNKATKNILRKKPGQEIPSSFSSV